MPIFAVILLVIFLLFRNMRVNATPIKQIKTVLSVSQYAQYEQEIINLANLESGYFTNTLSQKPIYNPFSMGVPRIRPSTRVGEYSNPNIDGGMEFSVYEDYAQATSDLLLYLQYIRMPLGLSCEEFNAYLASKGYSVVDDFDERLNKMCK